MKWTWNWPINQARYTWTLIKTADLTSAQPIRLALVRQKFVVFYCIEKNNPPWWWVDFRLDVMVFLLDDWICLQKLSCRSCSCSADGPDANAQHFESTSEADAPGQRSKAHQLWWMCRTSTWNEPSEAPRIMSWPWTAVSRVRKLVMSLLDWKTLEKISR